jgi:hypothetical protein
MIKFKQWLEEMANQQNIGSGDKMLDDKVNTILKTGGDVSSMATKELQNPKRDPKQKIWLQDLLRKGGKKVPGQPGQLGM